MQNSLEVMETDDNVQNGQFPVVQEAELMDAGESGIQSEFEKAGLESVGAYQFLQQENEEHSEEVGVSSEEMDAQEFDFESDIPIQDAYFGSYDPEPGTEAVTIESVIGNDDRIKINNTTSYPWRAIASLLIESKTGKFYVGTGWFVSARTLITAGHCVYLHNEGGWAKSIRVMAGRNGAYKPYGTITTSALRSVKGWTSSKKQDMDYGAIILPSNHRVGSQTGSFGYASLSDSSLKSKYLNLSGYPADKPSGTQWYHSRSVSRLSSRKIHYKIDTYGGQSGSPVWYIKNGVRYAVGIHAYGKGSGTTNSATRIVKPVFDNIKAWKAQGA